MKRLLLFAIIASTAVDVFAWQSVLAGERDLVVTKASIKSADANEFTAAQARKIGQHIKGENDDRAWAAVWFRLTPDGKITAVKVVTVTCGTYGTTAKTREIVRRLHHAILATKGFSYKGAPVPQGAPVGLVAIYHPHFQKSLSVHTFDADHAPAHVVFSKDSN